MFKMIGLFLFFTTIILFGLGAVQINFQKDTNKPLIGVSSELSAALGLYSR